MPWSLGTQIGITGVVESLWFRDTLNWGKLLQAANFPSKFVVGLGRLLTFL